MVWSEEDEIDARKVARRQEASQSILKPTEIDGVTWSVTYVESPTLRVLYTGEDPSGVYQVSHSKCNGHYSSGAEIPGSIILYTQQVLKEPEFNHLPKAIHYPCRDCGKEIPKQVKFIILMDQAQRKL